METKKAPLSIRLFYGITNVAFWLLVLIFLSLLVESILLYAGKKIELNSEGRTLPITLEFQQTGHLNLNNQSTTLKLRTYTEKIEIVHPPMFIAKKIALINLLISLIGIYILWIFRKFLKNVKRGKTFSIKNIFLLKKIAYIMAGSWLVHFVSAQFIIYFITKHIKFSQLQIMPDNYLLNSYLVLLWIALFIWVLAHIFITGLKLKQEKDLTI